MHRVESREGPLHLVFTGSSCSGKSTTCNTLLEMTGTDRSRFFAVYDEDNGTTIRDSHYFEDIPNLGLRIFDCPGFDCPELEKGEVESFVQQETRSILQKGLPCIFCLVVKFSPRPANFKNDLEILQNLFGSIVFNSLQLIFIDNSGKKKSAERWKELFGDMKDIIDIIKKGRPEFSTDWYVVWDNMKPKEEMLSELLTKIDRTPKFTALEYEAGQKELERRRAELAEKERERAELEIAEEMKRLDEENKRKEAELLAIQEDHQRLLAQRQEESNKKALHPESRSPAPFQNEVQPADSTKSWKNEEVPRETMTSTGTGSESQVQAVLNTFNQTTEYQEFQKQKEKEIMEIRQALAEKEWREIQKLNAYLEAKKRLDEEARKEEERLRELKRKENEELMKNRRLQQEEDERRIKELMMHLEEPQKREKSNEEFLKLFAAQREVIKKNQEMAQNTNSLLQAELQKIEEDSRRMFEDTQKKHLTQKDSKKSSFFGIFDWF